MPLLNRSELFDRLSKNTCQVNFTKVNGDERTMLCTLDPTRIEECPSEYSMEGAPEESGRMNVWDLEKHEWRSFLIESVKWMIIYDDASFS